MQMKVQESQALIQADQQKQATELEFRRAEMELKAQQMQQQMAFEAQKHEQEMAFEREKHLAEMSIRAAETDAKIDAQRQQAN